MLVKLTDLFAREADPEFKLLRQELGKPGRDRPGLRRGHRG